jgi:putative exosortase-associated protein (TIGR04073 family)
MARSRGWVVGVAALLCLFTLAAPAVVSAGQTANTGNPGRKLGRGLANLFLGAADIPHYISDVNARYGPAAATFYGPIKGLGHTLHRAVIGAFEVVTFIIPFKNVGYGPLIQPEYPGSFSNH